jgi:hypothetical protein
VQYKLDCEEFYGRTLDNHDVQSTVKGSSKQETSELWGSLYPEEPYELDLCCYSQENIVEKVSDTVASIRYDLVAAVKRQSSFSYQVTAVSFVQ